MYEFSFLHIILQAMELELQTHCAVSVEVKPSWVKGKCHSYRSENKELAGAEDQTSVPTVQVPGPSGDNRGCVPAAKSPVRVSRKPSLKATLNKNPPCRMCGAREDVSFWLGCGYRNPKTKKQDCPYWVHQNCIGLFYKQEGDLESVPFFCPKHGK